MVDVKGLTLKRLLHEIGRVRQRHDKIRAKGNLSYHLVPFCYHFYGWKTSPECVHINLSHLKSGRESDMRILYWEKVSVGGKTKRTKEVRPGPCGVELHRRGCERGTCASFTENKGQRFRE